MKQDIVILFHDILQIVKEKVKSKRIEASEFESYVNGLEKLAKIYYDHPIGTFARVIETKEEVK